MKKKEIRSASLVFKHVQKGDLPALLKIQGQLTPSTLEKAAAALKKMGAYPDYKIYLAIRREAVVGTFALLIMDNAGRMGSPIGIVENVVVDRAQRRRGYGQAMMKHAEALCRKAGCYKLILGSHLRLKDAHQFYESGGFVKQGFVFSLEL